MDLFGDVIYPERCEEAPDVNETRIDEELERWESSTTSIQTNGQRPEPILEYWKHQWREQISPACGSTFVAIPTPSAQIERDFGAGRLVTPQRGSIAPHNVDMSTFLNCNRSQVDITQCLKIPKRDIEMHIPSNVKLGLEDGDIEGCELMSGYFPGDSELGADGELD
ncbi:hypothetical protein V7S43_011128 [Phytophthora oleae]|uniref:HAT C-terminal dimerisation domain-containing protein n=1 Tax=Phytophthora oleae TaxID=2107226 RepID=A0ABD3FAB4_9STRA